MLDPLALLFLFVLLLPLAILGYWVYTGDINEGFLKRILKLFGAVSVSFLVFIFAIGAMRVSLYSFSSPPCSSGFSPEGSILIIYLSLCLITILSGYGLFFGHQRWVRLVSIALLVVMPLLIFSMYETYKFDSCDEEATSDLPYVSPEALENLRDRQQ